MAKAIANNGKRNDRLLGIDSHEGPSQVSKSLLLQRMGSPPLTRRDCPRERPRGCRAAEQRDELVASHSITSSAMASTPGGIVRPSDLATLRLISNSNLADCTTGSSAGRAPPKILPL